MKHKILLLFIVLITTSFVYAAVKKPLPIGNAFHFSISPTKTDSILANWQIAPGYYLYKNRFNISVKSPRNAKIGFILMPAGIEKNDTILGKHFVYKNKLMLSIPILNPTTKPLSLVIKYQGCAEWGFCYPPQTKLITIKNSNAPTAGDITVSDYQKITNNKISNIAVPLSQQTEPNAILQHQNMLISLILFFGFGLLLAFTPCVLPLIPILSGIIVGHGKKLTTLKAFCLSLAYVLGMSTSFAAAGLVIGLLGSSVGAAMQQPWVLILFSLLFVLLALSLFGLFELHIPTSWQKKIAQLSEKQTAGHYFSIAIMGALSTLIVSPCVTAPLVGALAYIGKTGNVFFGGSALFLMGLGMGAPLLIIGTSFGKLLPKAGHWMDTIKLFFGVVMLGVAIWLVERIISGPLTLFLWASLIIVSSIYMGALAKTPKSGWGKLWKGCGIILLIYGILLVIGSGMGSSNLFQPLSGHFFKTTSSSRLSFKDKKTVGLNIPEKLIFKPVKNIADVERAMRRAKIEGKPIMLDFYADWCVACKELDRNLFSKSDVRSVLARYTLLRADVTKNDAFDRALKAYYGVLGPPTILLFNKKGEEVKNARVVGNVDVDSFLRHVGRIK